MMGNANRFVNGGPFQVGIGGIGGKKPGVGVGVKLPGSGFTLGGGILFPVTGGSAKLKVSITAPIDL